MFSKPCSKCGVEKPLDEYYAGIGGLGGRKSRCKPCYLQDGRAYNSTPRGKELARDRHRRREPNRTDRGYSRERRVQWQFNLTPEQLEAILATQGGACAICHAPEAGGKGNWHVDHDRSCCPGDKSCGRCVRGLLCSRCNPMLGMAKDNADTLRAAIDYLLDVRAVV